MATPELTTRRFAGPADIVLITDFVRRVRPPARAADHPTVVHLPETLKLSHNTATLRLWFAAGRLAAYAFVDNFETLRFDLDPALTSPALEAALMAWADACRQADTPAGSAPLELFASCHSDDEARLALLRRSGFALLEFSVLHLERPLAAPIAQPELPPGFSLRPLAGAAEAAAVAALHREAFGGRHMTTERRLAMLQAPEYDPSLDLVVVAPGGELAAYGMGAVHLEENAHTGRSACYTDMFGTAAAYRGRGLALALLLSLLRRLQPRGFELAKLNTGSGNAAMQHVAARAGFSLASRTLLFEREPPPPPAPK